jgi:hypothetical protein
MLDAKRTTTWEWEQAAQTGTLGVLKAYLDASNEDTGNPVAVVAGFVGGERQWEAFDAAWKPFLLEFGLKRFHATEFWARKGPYNNWSEANIRW